VLSEKQSPRTYYRPSYQPGTGMIIKIHKKGYIMKFKPIITKRKLKPGDKITISGLTGKAAIYNGTQIIKTVSSSKNASIIFKPNEF